MSTGRRRNARKANARSPKPTRLPLVSSAAAHAALRRLGFIDGLVLGKKEIPRGTLEGVLKLANVTRDEFVKALR